MPPAEEETRVIPLFLEILPYLHQAFEEAEPGGGVRDHRPLAARWHQSRQQLNRFITRAGLTPWPRVWHNLRASRQTELSARFPPHVVCTWLGNTTTVATPHDLTVRESDFA